MSSAAPLQNLTGLASGLDTNTIISQLMAVEKQPQQRIINQQAVEAARQQALKDTMTRLQNLQTAYQGLSDPTVWADTQTVESSDSTKVVASRATGIAPGSYTVVVGNLAAAQQQRSASLSSVATGGTLTVGVGATSIQVDVADGASLDQIAASINAASGTPVYASVVNSQLYLASKTAGSSGTITLSSTDASGTADPTLTNELGFTVWQPAVDANVTIKSTDGTSLFSGTVGSNTVTNAIPGLTLTLKAPTDANGITVTVGTPSPDTDAISKKIQGFVDQYNSTLSFIQGELEEHPVASPQNASDLTKGVLYGDSGLTSLLSSMRQAIGGLFTRDPGQLQTLSQVGLSTGATTGSGSIDQDAVDGKLSLDTDTLADQLSSNFAQVKSLFTNATSSYDTEGLGQRLSGIVDPWLTDATAGGILQSRIAGEDDTIKELKDQQSDWDQRLALKEQQYRAQFTALETALSQAQTQGQWLSGQIASLPSNG
ncbi:MAG TPA: flagellar filament capping protein FliD [Gaiellaceae bacterium]|jgi:flagellar hook-associated protein 2